MPSTTNWTTRKRSCSTVYTHKDIPWQVIHSHNTGKIEWRQIDFDTVEEAMLAAEDWYNV